MTLPGTKASDAIATTSQKEVGPGSGGSEKCQSLTALRTGALCLTLEKLAMKKSLVALAAMAVAGIASAQSSVTLFGVVDATISGFSNKSEDRNAPTLESLANQTFVNRGTATTSQTVLRN